MVEVCKEHVKRLPKAHNYHIVKPKDCKLCKLTEEEIKEYVEYRKNHLWSIEGK
jgi:uncharacterized protein YnzC (UPF0291/DUF896 family)